MRNGKKASYSGRKGVLEALYNEGFLKVEDVAEAAGIPKPTAYDALTTHLSKMVEARKFHMPDRGWRIHYGLKNKYRVLINDCIDGGIDIFESIDYDQGGGKRKRAGPETTPA